MVIMTARILRRSALVLLALTLVAGAVFALWWARLPIDTRGDVAFERELPIPPLADARVDPDGTRVFSLRMQRGETDFGRSNPTTTWGFDGSFGGPTLRAQRGERVRFEIANDLGEPSTVHWHGMHLPAEMDGGPHQIIEPDRTWRPGWQIDQPAATTWYHPHLHGRTLEHVAMGLAGFFILDDDERVQGLLPREYGVDDLPLMVTDRSFTGDDQFDLSDGFFTTVGSLGDTLLVNGAVGPYFDASTERVRLRLLNASVARVFDFGFDDDRPFAMIASDGGLLAAPHTTDRIRLGPGERAEIVVDLEAAERTVLQSFPPEGISRWDGGADHFDVLELRADEELADSPAIPSELAQLAEPDPGEADVERTFDLAGHTINGQAMDAGRYDAVVERGVPEVWEVFNRDGSTHLFHVHDRQFRVLEYDGAPPPPELAGWKDTVDVPSGSDGVRLLVRFDGHSDPNWPYMFHCHVLRHEDQGMMGQFVVVEPGQDAGPPPPTEDAVHAH